MPPVPDLKPLDDDAEDPRPRPDVRYMVAQGKHAELRALSYAIRNGHHEDYSFDNEDLDALVAWEDEEEALGYKEPPPVYHEADAVNECREAERRRRKEEKAKRKRAAFESSTGWLSTRALLGLSAACLSIALVLWMIFWVTADNHMLVLILFV
ncbi:hypothetical protein H112_05975 [Trichophyton rubrum D6]|uniref:Uncharacterized protein n=3 Tax=Trichophyton TaxID=5550 RepID=F2SLF3_TRIRC|nr:uncharacterized protein TERG_03683 [Trichophyton rubrum CBS 118892]EZF14803.1 hypothetical protein H100_05990 [Trichophyton rubrum MR850]EZF39920.1 hypothetical protein H102_05959 [Trichophyton rubrum CBS 100081]EZF50560.1 hypothetical protein H103_05984 [Trichophyton rubrum CBS 288.86]EZF61104.1 hypothetical protein H104_05972 [Trichophyton rubrum CBS 289.86]EZF71737.1 hypothetical protein H105_05999 [Trichophyton soudanense CBS 452.61]EZF82320.1 hypothetical protein H110_05980 [Trichophy